MHTNVVCLFNHAHPSFRYQHDNDEDDEHDDYGFNKRPSVRGIKPRFGTTTEILQQIQSHMQPPLQAKPVPNNHISWPYYSEASLSGVDNKSRNINHNHYVYVSEEMKAKGYVQYRPTSFVSDNNVYQNCANQRCNRDVQYRPNVNSSHMHVPLVRVGDEYSVVYHHAKIKGRPESPPPLDVARNFHQTMVYIPYNHIETYHTACSGSPNTHYASSSSSGSEKCYVRVANQNQINSRFTEPLYHNQPRIVTVEHGAKPLARPTPPHISSSRSESPLPGQYSTARSTQTPVVASTMPTCNYYTTSLRYRPIAPPGIAWTEAAYVNKVNRHSFPAAVPRYPAVDNISLTDSDSQYSTQISNGYRKCIETTFPVQKDSVPNSPTKPRFIERGAPEGAASVSPQDSAVLSQSTMTSPTSPQNLPPNPNPKPLYYAMNV